MGDAMASIDTLSLQIGKLTEGVDHLKTHVYTLAREQQLTRVEVQDHGKEIAQLRLSLSHVDRRQDRISREVNKVEEITGVHHIAEIQRRAAWSTGKKIAATVAGLLTALAAASAVLGFVG